jgi:hypothetical protein
MRHVLFFIALLLALEIYSPPQTFAANPMTGGSALSVTEPETFILLGAGMVIAALLFHRFGKKTT